MNHDNMMRLADHLAVDVSVDEFNMHVWARKAPCGTVGCVAGHALMLAQDGEMMGWLADHERLVKFEEDVTYRDVEGYGPTSDRSYAFDKAQEWLGLTDREAMYLFYPSKYSLNTATKLQAVRRIREMVDMDRRGELIV